VEEQEGQGMFEWSQEEGKNSKSRKYHDFARERTDILSIRKEGKSGGASVRGSSPVGKFQDDRDHSRH